MTWSSNAAWSASKPGTYIMFGITWSCHGPGTSRPPAICSVARSTAQTESATSVYAAFSGPNLVANMLAAGDPLVDVERVARA